MIARHIEHQFEAGAGTHRELVQPRLERLGRLAVDGDDQRLRADDPDIGQPRRRGVAEPEPHPRAGAGGKLQRRGGAIGEDEPRRATSAVGEGRIGEIVPDLTLVVDIPVGQDDREIRVNVRLFRFVHDDRTEQAAALLRRVRLSRHGASRGRIRHPGP